jgi:hypothetical protein
MYDSSWHEFKNSIMAEIRLFHSQPLMNYDFQSLHYCKIGYLPNAKPASKISSSICATFTSTTDVLSKHGIIIMEIQSIIFKICTIFWHDALSIHHHHTPLSGGGKFYRGHMLCAKKSNHTTNLFAGPSVHCWCHSMTTCALNSTWLTDSCTMRCILLLLQVLLLMKKLNAWLTHDIKAEEP